jgi:hypothetical protein
MRAQMVGPILLGTLTSASAYASLRTGLLMQSADAHIVTPVWSADTDDDFYDVLCESSNRYGSRCTRCATQYLDTIEHLARVPMTPEPRSVRVVTNSDINNLTESPARRTRR